MKDVHPLLILSPREFNDRTGIIIGPPMTTAFYNDTNPFAVPFAGPKGVISYILAPAKALRLASSICETAPLGASAGADI